MVLSVVSGPSGHQSIWDLLETQTLGPHPRHTELETLGLRSCNCFNKSSALFGSHESLRPTALWLICLNSPPNLCAKTRWTDHQDPSEHTVWSSCCPWPSLNPIFINDLDGGTDGALISLTDDRDNGADTLNDDISTQRWEESSIRMKLNRAY